MKPYNKEDVLIEMPLSITIILDKLNYYDSKLIWLIENYTKIIFKSESGYSITSESFLKAIEKHFKKELESVLVYPKDRMWANINNIFQLYSLFKYYKSTKVINAFIISSGNINKLQTVKQDKFISTDFKFDKCVIRYDKYFDKKELSLVLEFFRKLGLVKTIEGEHVINIQFYDYMKLLDQHKKDLKYKFLYDFNKDIFIEKFDHDNVSLSLIIDNLVY